VHLQARHLLEAKEQIEVGFGRVGGPATASAPAAPAAAETRVAEAGEGKYVVLEGGIDVPFGNAAAIVERGAPSAETVEAAELGRGGGGEGGESEGERENEENEGEGGARGGRGGIPALTRRATNGRRCAER